MVDEAMGRYGEIWGDVARCGEMHRVVDEALLGVRDGEHALHAEEVLAARLEQRAEPRVQQLEVELAALHLLRVRVRVGVRVRVRVRMP